MNSLKKTETVITLINTAALLGITIYFYKRNNNLELDMNKHSEQLTATIKKVREVAGYKKHLADLSSAFKKLNQFINIQNQDIETLKEIVRFQNNQIMELQSVVLQLREHKDENKTLDFKLKENSSIQAITGLYNRRPNQITGNQPMFGNSPYNNLGFNPNNQPVAVNVPNNPNNYNYTNNTNGFNPMNNSNGMNNLNGMNNTNGFNPMNNSNGMNNTNGFNPNGINGTNNPNGINGMNNGYRAPMLPSNRDLMDIQMPDPMNSNNYYGNNMNNNMNNFNQFSEDLNDEDNLIDAVRRRKEMNNDSSSLFD